MIAPSSNAPLSVVVATRNSAATIEACLEAILDTIPAPLREVFVVDNGSTDRTLELVRHLPVRLECIPPGFVSVSRNIAARRARHDIVAFVDSDCVVQPGWREAIHDVLADPTVGVAGSRYALRERPAWVEFAWDRAHRRTSGDERAEVRYLPGGNLAVRREQFLSLGGFDEALETGEDMDLCARYAASGLRIVDARSIRSVHLGEPQTLRGVFRRNRWHGRGARLRYADGRFAPITLSTIVFAISTIAGVIGAAWALLGRNPWWALAALAPLTVPGLYAARYAKPLRLQHFAQLLLVYCAYFLGRATALATVMRRAWQRRQG